MDKCPKCGKKLSLFYVKQTCKDCGCNILYYNMEQRLEEDAEQAEKEFQTLERILNKITPSFIKRRKEMGNEDNGIE